MPSAHVIAVGGPPTFRPQIARALRTDPESIDWVQTVSAAETAAEQSPTAYELLVLSPLVDEAEATAIARSLAKRSPTTAVVVVRDRPLDGALPRLVRAGVRDVVDLSSGIDELEDALALALAWSESVRHIGNGNANGNAHARGRVVSVFSTKGGTGKTFLATNLAAALAERSAADTAVLDLDVDFGDVFAYFGKEPKRSLSEVAAEVGLGAKPEEIAELGTRLAEHVVGFGSPQDPGAVGISPEATADLVRMLRSSFAYTVVDATCDYTDHVIKALELSDDVLFVTGLDVISVRHLSMAMRTLEELGVPRDRMRVVLNRADSKVELTAGDIEDALGLKIDAQIPSSALVPRSVNRSELLWFSERRSTVAKGVADLADRLRQGSEPSDASTRRRARRLGGRHERGETR
jgi:pilus assembly protein CpaE